MQVPLMDDANIMPLLISNSNHWWNKVKACYPPHVYHILDYGHKEGLAYLPRILEFGTSTERLAYSNLLDAAGYMIIAQAQARC